MDMAEAEARIGHWRLDPVGNSLFWSDEVYRIYGLSPDAPPDLEQAIAAYHPDDRAMVGAIVERALDTLEPFKFRARIIRGDGSIRHVSSRGQVEWAPNGKAIGLFGVFQDITEQHLAEAELVAARDAARAAGDAKAAFLATMSHEIRTPLTGVVGMIELLRLPGFAGPWRHGSNHCADGGSIGRATAIVSRRRPLGLPDQAGRQSPPCQ